MTATDSVGEAGAWVTEALPAALASVERPGSFAAGGRVRCPMPAIEVDGVGMLAWPLPSMQAEALARAAERAPYGRGAETLVDVDVRRCWQLGPERLTVDDPGWEGTIAGVVDEVRRGLGVTGEVRAELYKLLVYDAGSFFVEHRDTEKAPGMFGTLVVALPSAFEGGELVVRHGGEEARFELGARRPSEVAWAAFYADCPHELRPVTAGWRVVLVYNLVRGGEALAPPDNSMERTKVAEVFRRWRREGGPVKVALLLEHHYTPEGLSFEGLKNRDAAVAAVVCGAARDAGCTSQLAMVSLHEAGAAEYMGGSGRRWGRRWYEEAEASDDPDDYEIIEIFEREQVVGGWLTPEGGAPALVGAVELLDEEITPPGALEGQAPDEQLFTEATGNEGGSFERTYRRAALVVWPDEGLMDVIAQGALEASTAAFKALAERGAAGAERLGARLIERMAARPRPGADPLRVRLLEGLALLGDRGLIRAMVEPMARLGALASGEAEALVACARALGWTEGGALLVGLAEAVTPIVPGAVAALMARVAEVEDEGAREACSVPLARAVLGALPDKRLYEWTYRSDEGVNAVTAERLLRAMGSLDGELASEALEAMVARSDVFLPDEVMVPAAVALWEGTTERPEWLRALRKLAIEHLVAGCVAPPEPPADWTREANVGCSCANCRDFARFLASPSEPRWVYKAAEAKRSHVEGTIRSARSDVDYVTEKRGSPHSLVCTKNQRSYEARLARYEADVALLRRLELSPDDFEA